ncbi:MAG: hypothetical protein NZM38_05715 [Cytophagales bacterium]|nr:hypothetical protein [Cytophagales bacterium]MDW8384252.1 hypothetical protein [Flammeovirgaceae bacterium]
MSSIFNDPELQPKAKYLGTITKDFAKVAELLKEASYQIKVRKISDYPIFVMSKTPSVIGLNLISTSQHRTEWNYNVSYLDEFVQRGLIKDVSYFQSTYKNIDEFCCLFVIDEDFIKFVYLPYPSETPLDDFIEPHGSNDNDE